MVKKIIVIGSAVLFLVNSSLIAQAEGEEIQLNVNVLPRKVTDTENDFDFSSISYEKPEQSRVLGAQTEKIPEKSTYRQYIAFVLTGNISLVLLDYYLSK
jgi:hypothetical protein